MHDYLVNNTKYDYDNFIKNTIPQEDYTAYGVLINGTGVCEGYSYAIKRLLKAVSIDSIIVDGNSTGDTGGPHAWNMVKLGNDYYQLDVTYDDPVVNNGTKDVLSHEYFNITDSQISKDHSWDKSKYPVCNGTAFKFNNN